ncbi:DUF1835 domain-containing protein [Sungkyunkwania multivorans]|uniref:DUF1835 domain-containing protein n=1 Tax=Sungkyunkwania multivorans TaxID=1173618 RepID=A0ABW3CZ43_9FLAO
MERILHITNGDSLSEYLKDLKIEGHVLTWREMLCEGPTDFEIGSEYFIKKRIDFLKEYYDIPIAFYQQKFVEELKSIEDINNFESVILWFEYDLFCHINMIAAISWLKQQNAKRPVYLVCSGRVHGEDGLKGLTELTKAQLMEHYANKIALKNDDLLLAVDLWRLYNSQNHTTFKKYVTQPSSFPYLSSCLSAHLKRFPSNHNGLGLLEVHILNLIDKEVIRSKRQLLGYTLHRQGYYGLGDLQIEKIIKKLTPFYTHEDDRIVLNLKGQLALKKEADFYDDMKDGTIFGQAKKYAAKYDIITRNLITVQL